MQYAGVRTTKHTHQPFMFYRGKVTTPAGQPYPNKQPLEILIDRCTTTPKVALVSGAFPGYYCGSSEVFPLDLTLDLYHPATEAALQNGGFTFTAQENSAPFQTYTVTGTVTGTVNIPKHGRGIGSGEIKGTITPQICPSLAFPYEVTFAGTYSYIIRGGFS